MKEVVLFTLLLISLGYGTTNPIPFIPLMSIRLDRCTSYCHPKFCNVTTVCRPLNRTSKFVSMDVYFHRGVKLEAPVYFRIVTYKKFATVYRPHMVNFRPEACKELSFRTHPLIVFGKDLNISANFLDPCPISGHRYTKPRITNVYDYVLPSVPLIPAGEWRADLILSVNWNGSEVVVLSTSDYYEVKSLTAQEF